MTAQIETVQDKSFFIFEVKYLVFNIILTSNKSLGLPTVENRYGHNATSVFLAQCTTVCKYSGNSCINATTLGNNGSTMLNQSEEI